MGDAAEFGGVIGRYRADVAGLVARAGPARRQRPRTSLVVVLDDVGFAQLGLLRLRHRHPAPRRPGRRRAALRQLPHHRAVLAHPGLRAHRAQPPLGGHGPHHRPGHRVPRLRRPHPPLGRVPARDARARTATRPTRSASGTSPPRTSCTWARPGHAGRSAAASSASTASSTARPTSSRLRWSTTTTGWSRPARPTRATTSPRTWPTRPSSSSATCATSTRPSRSCSTSRPGACHSPHQAPARVDRALPRPLRRRLGRVARAEALERQQPLRPPAAETGALAPARLGAGLGRPRRRPAAGCTPATWSASPASSPTPTTRSAGSSTSSAELGELDDTVGAWCSPTTAPRAPRAARPGRSTTCGRGTWPTRPVDEALDRLDEIGGPRIHNNYPWGWTVAGNTPFRRWKRETHEGGVCDPLIVSWPGHVPARGEVRRQYVHAIDLLPTLLEPHRRRRAGRAAAAWPSRPLEGTSFADVPRRRRRSRGRAPPSTTRCSAAGPSTTRAGRRSPTADVRGPTVAFDDDLWELYDVRVDPVGVPRPGRAPSPTGCRRMIERWWDEAERHQVLPLDYEPVLRGLVFGARRSPRRGGRYVYRPGTGPVEESVAVNVRNRVPPSSCRGRRARPPAPKGCWPARARATAAGCCSWLDGQLAYAHNFVARGVPARLPRRPRGPGRHELGSASTARVSARWRGHAGGRRRPTSGRSRSRRFTPTRWAITGDGSTVRLLARACRS